MEKTTPEGKNAKITEITYPEKRKMFTEVNGVKVMNEYNEKTAVRGAHIEKQTESSYNCNKKNDAILRILLRLKK